MVRLLWANALAYRPQPPEGLHFNPLRKVQLMSRSIAIAGTMLLSLLVSAAPQSAAAQAKPDLSGIWVLDLAMSDFGMMPAPISRTDVIDHKEPALTISRTQNTPNGEITANLVYRVDGQPHVNDAAGQEVTSSLAWDGMTLVITSNLTIPQGDVTIVDRMTLSGDGKTLNSHRTLSIQGQEIVQTSVLHKQ